MPPVERSLADVFQDIIRNLQEIIRAEVRLAKTEVRDEFNQARGGALALGIGVLTGAFALFFLLLAAVYGLSEVVPNWAAPLIVSVGLMLSAAVAISGGLRRLKRLQVTPKTIESLKENVEWAKQQTK